MDTRWEIVESGPADATKTVLMLPGGMASARSWAEVMAEPTLANHRLVAATLPGNAGAPPPVDFSFEACARTLAELAREVGADVVAGFSNGANLACEMVTSGAFAGPVVLLGSSFSAADEPAFFRALIRLGRILGTLPFVFLRTVAASLVKSPPFSPERRAELRADFARNDAHDLRRTLDAYLRWLHRSEDRAQRLCAAGVPTWVVHAEKGDGGLTRDERTTLEHCAHVRLVTLPGRVFFIPNEAPRRIAEIISEALATS